MGGSGSGTWDNRWGIRAAASRVSRSVRGSGPNTMLADSTSFVTVAACCLMRAMPDELRRPGFDPSILYDAEAEILAHVARGEIAAFHDTQRPTIRAAFLRHLLLQLSPGDWPIRSPGVRIRGVRIEDLLDLSDSVGLPGLALEACELAGPLD